MSKDSGIKRPLTTGEIKMAKTIFGDQIDYAKVRIHNRKLPMQPKDGGLCTGNTININGEGYADDFSEEPLYLQGFFMHEMTHIWQYQTSFKTLAKKFAQSIIKHPLTYMRDAYHYMFDDKKEFKDYGHEQQACIVEDFFVLTYCQDPEYVGRCKNTDMNMPDRIRTYQTTLAPVFEKVPAPLPLQKIRKAVPPKPKK